jgi:cytochrome P450
MCNEEQRMQLYDEKTNETRAVVLPAGCRVYLSSPGVHYNTRYWEDAGELKPERWFTDKFSHQGGAEADQGGKHVVAADKTRQMRGTLLTFSDGARACLGRKFAQAEYMAFFATLLRRFRVTFADGVDVNKIKSDLNDKSAGKIVSLTPLRGFPLELRQRMPA